MLSVENNTLVCLALKEFGQVGSKLFQQLMILYGDPANVFDIAPENLSSMTGINLERAIKAIDSRNFIDESKELISRLESLKITAVGYFDDLYPESLRKIIDPPLVIYVKGDLSILGNGGVAIVGSTSANQDGINFAVQLAREFSNRGQVVISGLAAGIDSAAHLGCLKSQGKTIAVLGCGHLNIYPEENIPLAGLIEQSGAVVSEFDIYADAIPGRLVSRNRIIAALSDIVVLAQIGEGKKGELYTAQAAVEQSKPVYVYDPDNKYDSETLMHIQVNKLNKLSEIDEILKYIVR